MSPFAHPLFTVLTGIGFGISALSAQRQRVRRVLLPLAGLLLAMGMHALWNGSTALGDYGFLVVYLAFMVPAFGVLTWLVVWTRQRELRTVRAELPAYAVAGWLTPVEPFALGSMRARRVARRYARRHGGKEVARAVAQYEAYATSLAFLRHRGRAGRAGADFVVRERELLEELWCRRAAARPALEHAARATAPPLPVAAAPWPVHGYGQGHGYGYGQGHGYGYGQGHGYGQGYGGPYPAYGPQPYPSSPYPYPGGGAR
ncbi:RsiW-degrading membrane proteinase PrsW (M82 family) OS=Streptomyces griseomycini OX=66895 GN=FHS37_001798 PE=4 SV=1 [Streptomyces griseomycini]